MTNLTKMMPLLVSMRAMCDAMLLEIADEQKKTQKATLRAVNSGPCAHEIDPGFGATGVCKLCGETVAREVKHD
jgi:hypothetical protein